MQTPFSIRQARVSDAAPLNNYLRQIYARSDHLITRSAEFRMGTLRQRLWIARKRARQLETCLVAVNGSQIIGMLDSWTDGRKRVRHTATFAMSVHEDHRRKGVGKKLLCHFIDWVQKHDILERIELHVHSDNIAAIELYQSLGFQLEGTRRNAVRYEDGRSVDDHIMVLWPTSPVKTD